MEYIYPTYYNNFHCIADACPKTCCAGWQIEIDEDALERYRQLQIDTVDYREAAFLQDEKKRCKNLDEQGLCRLIYAHGEEILCDTCRLFPRHTEVFDGVRELSLSISCPEVARMILTNSDNVVFTTEERAEKETEAYTEEERIVYRQLRQLRDWMIPVGQDRSLSLEQRFAKILSTVQAYQDCVDCCMEENRFLNSIQVSDAFAVEDYAIDTSLHMLQVLLAVTKEWEYTESELSDVFIEVEAYLDAIDEVSLHQARKHLSESLQKQEIALPVILEQIYIYFLFAYFCGSVYDEYYFGQAQLAVAACYHIEAILLWHFGKYKSIGMEDIIRYTYLYARELEHSIPNILATEAYMDAHPMI
ncbi:MAG: flagellin lysine-N-methylase [Lachnospiraceae bacterium]|nr:flagellin lysine-N-methylase [Lachnospiraceae bacterium]